MKPSRSAMEEIMIYGEDIVRSEGLQKEKQYVQHGKASVYVHSIGVAYISLRFVSVFHIRVDKRALVRGALLHDYFLYDWHVPDPSHRLHGFFHAKCALRNAKRDFELNSIEHDIIEKHMFPLNLAPPRYRESVIVCTIDKFCSLCETMSINYFNMGRMARADWRRQVKRNNRRKAGR